MINGQISWGGKTISNEAPFEVSGIAGPYAITTPTFIERKDHCHALLITVVTVMTVDGVENGC